MFVIFAAVGSLALEAERVKIDIVIELKTKYSVAPHKTIDLDAVDEYVELSICMRGYERRGKRWQESVIGQGTDYVLEHFGKDPAVAELCAFWRRWHLNGLRAGNRAQRRFLDEKAEWVAQTHEKVKQALPLVSLFQVESELLEMHDLSPHDGYKYGSAWLVERLPVMAIEKLKILVEKLGGKLVTTDGE